MAWMKKYILLETPLKSREALKELGTITGADDIPKLIQDSLRTNEWVVFWQSKKRAIAALSDQQLVVLAEHGCDIENDARLENFIRPGMEERATTYFQK